MLIYVLDTNLERIGTIDTMSSIIWTNRYYTWGDFELYVSATNKNLAMLQEGYYLIRDGHEENAMIIKKIQITTDVESGNYLTVTGQCLKSIIYQRIIWNMTSVTGKVESCVARLLNENAINPEIAARKISNLVNTNTLSTDYIMTAQYTGDNLGETIAAICQNYELGWDVQLDLDNKQFNFILYQGTDRSYDQSEIPPVVFSNEYENLLRTTYTYDLTNYKNVAKVAGEGEGLARRYVTVGNTSGLERFETYVDARDVSSNEGQISNDEYNSQLTERGNEKLAELDYTENFEGEVETNYTYTFGEDYFIGDIVEVVNEYGIAASTRILEVIQSEDESGIYTIPTFSNYILKED